MLATIPLTALHVDRSVSLRQSDCQATIRRYARALDAGDHLPSLDVCIDDQGEYWLADGFLRYAAHQQVGTREITVRVHEGGARGASMLACGANDCHGRQRTIAEKRAAVERMLRDPEWGRWSNHRIAEFCRVSHTFVAKMREHQGQEPQPRTGRDGRPVKPRRRTPDTRELPALSTARRSSAPAPRVSLPPVDPQQAAEALARLTAVRDTLALAVQHLHAAQTLVPDPQSAEVAAALDQALVSLLPWVERVLPTEEATPERKDAAEPDTAEQVFTSAHVAPEPRAWTRDDADVEHRAASAVNQRAEPISAAGSAVGPSRPRWVTDQMRDAMVAAQEGDGAAMRRILAQQHAAFAAAHPASSPGPSLATLPDSPAGVSSSV